MKFKLDGPEFKFRALEFFTTTHLVKTASADTFFPRQTKHAQRPDTTIAKAIKCAYLCRRITSLHNDILWKRQRFLNSPPPTKHIWA